jgi:hypothetical protein
MKISSFVRAAAVGLAAALVITAVAEGQQVTTAFASLPAVDARLLAPVSGGGEVAVVLPTVSVNGPALIQAGVTLPALVSFEAEAMQGPRQRRNVRWMIVGGAMLVGGAIVGGDVGTIVSVGGLVIGGVGLYRYLQ